MSLSDGRSRLLAYVGLLAIAVGLLAVAVFDTGGIESDTERIQRLNESFACPVCNGESVAESNAAISATIRSYINDQVTTTDASDREIRDALLATYEVDVLLNPPGEGFAALIWVLPVLVGALAAVGAAAAMTRERGGQREASSEDVALVAEARRRIGT